MIRYYLAILLTIIHSPLLTTSGFVDKSRVVIREMDGDSLQAVIPDAMRWCSSPPS